MFYITRNSHIFDTQSERDTDKKTKVALRYWSETLKRVVSAYNMN